MCERCRGNIIEDRREDRSYCLSCGFEPLTTAEEERQKLALRAYADHPPDRRRRGASINGMRLD